MTPVHPILNLDLLGFKHLVLHLSGILGNDRRECCYYWCIVIVGSLLNSLVKDLCLGYLRKLVLIQSYCQGQKLVTQNQMPTFQKAQTNVKAFMMTS